MSGPPIQTDSQSTAQEAQEKVGEIAGQAQERAQQAAGQVQDRVRQQLDARSGQAAEQIHSQAADLRSVSEALREQGKDGPAKLAEQVAERAERVAGYLERKDSNAILSDAEDFGRRQPWAVAVGGVLAGFAASRLLKASSLSRYEGRTLPPRTGNPYAGSGLGVTAPGAGYVAGAGTPYGGGLGATPLPRTPQPSPASPEPSISRGMV